MFLAPAAASCNIMAEAAAGGSAPPPAPVLLKNGQVIQNYEIIKPLGKGKFSIVYMAKRLTDDSMCALKKINIFDMMVPKQREKCLKEVRLLQSLDHPNIVKLKDSFIDNNELLIIVEWAEKGDLKWLIRRAVSRDVRFKETEIWEYSRQLSSALDHMHQKRIMHRDLKPANIFVAIDGALKLGDLGLGRFFSSQTLEAFSKVGTPLYMSPEVLRGAGYDMRSDVWSLGCVLYELAMLRSPFKSDQQLSLYDLFVRISKGDYPPLPESLCSSDFRELISWMLALDPEKRLHCHQVLEICTARVATLVAELAKQKVSGTAEPAKAQQSSGGIARGLSRPSPLLVMDDIVEKLKLLECEEQFLRPLGFPILHRCFFVEKVTLPGKVTQFEVMYELIKWLLSQVSQREAKGRKEALEREEAADASAGPPSKTRNKAAPATATNVIAEADAGGGGAAASSPKKESTVDFIPELVSELAARGIQISADASLTQVRQGYGESVCLILNELINQELVGRDFHFEAPAWGALRPGGAEDGGEADEVDEELDDSASVDSQVLQGHDAEASYVSADGRDLDHLDALMEHSLGSSMLREQVHIAQVDPDAWKAEVERAKPLLRMSSEAAHPPGGWQCTFAKMKELCGRVQELCPEQGMLEEGLRSCCRQWRHELKELRQHEDRLSNLFSDPAGEAARLKAETAPQAEAIATLQNSIADLSEQLSSLTEELEKEKSAVTNQTENALDSDKLPNLKKAFQKLRDETRQLDQRIGCVQAELTVRQLKRPVQHLDKEANGLVARYAESSDDIS